MKTFSKSFECVNKKCVRAKLLRLFLELSIKIHEQDLQFFLIKFNVGVYVEQI